MKPKHRFALLATTLITVIGCSAGQAPSGTEVSSGTLTPGQEASAKTLGIDTAKDVKANPGMYTGDINFAKSGVDGQQKRIDAENAAVKAMTTNPH